MEKLTPEHIKAFNTKTHQMLETLPTPDGFTRTFTHFPGKDFDAERLELQFENETVKIKVVAYVHEATKASYIYQMADGHTSFKTDKGWLTYDRLGISDSFYVQADTTAEALTAKIAEEITRARAGIDRAAKSIQLPGIGFTCLKTPEQVDEIKKKLRDGKVVTLAPGGMGTGVYLSTRKSRSRYGTAEAHPELKKLLGFNTLWTEKFDHD